MLARIIWNRVQKPQASSPVKIELHDDVPKRNSFRERHRF